MILCTDCGELHQDDAVFCSRCGVFLEWRGQQLDHPVNGSSDPDPEAPPAWRPGEWVSEERLEYLARQQAGENNPPDPDLDPTAIPEHDQPAATDDASSTGWVTLDGADDGEEPPEWVPGEWVTDERLSWLARHRRRRPTPNPAHEPEPVEESVDPTLYSRQPEISAGRRQELATRRVDTVADGPLRCADCGWGNTESRSFCSRCGFALHQIRDQDAEPGWWQRLWNRTRGRDKHYVAGTRIGARKRRRVLLPVVLASILVLVALVAWGPLHDPASDAYDDAQNYLLDPEQVRPVDVSSTPSLSNLPPQLAVDGATNTHWAAAPDPAPTLTATMQEPVDLREVGITAGVALDTPTFLAGPRPENIELIATSRSGVEIKQVTLDDRPGFQKISFDVDGVRTIAIKVTSNRGATPEVATAIVEVEFYARR